MNFISCKENRCDWNVHLRFPLDKSEADICPIVLRLWEFISKKLKVVLISLLVRFSFYIRTAVIELSSFLYKKGIFKWCGALYCIRAKMLMMMMMLFCFMQKRNGHVYFRMNSMRSKELYGWIDRLLAFEMRSPLFVSSLWLMLKLELSVAWFDSILVFFVSSVSYYALNRMILLQREWIRRFEWWVEWSCAVGRLAQCTAHYAVLIGQ